MLRYVTGNIFDSPAQTLVNAVNTVGVMGKGIAAEFKTRYPDMYRSYREHCRRKALTIGKLQLFRTENKWVLNFPTKEHWRYPSKLEYISAGLAKFVETFAQQGITSVAFPRLGTGNGGLPWDEVVRPVMELHLSSISIPVYIHVVKVPPNFVPEHLSKRARREYRRPRLAVTFDEFLRDLHEVGAIQSVVSPPEDDGSSIVWWAAPGREPVMLDGEELEILWQDLRIHGAIKVSHYPGGLAPYARELTRSLTQLDYIKPCRFEGGAAEGIRYAPAANETERTELVPEREALEG